MSKPTIYWIKTDYHLKENGQSFFSEGNPSDPSAGDSWTQKFMELQERLEEQKLDEIVPVLELFPNNCYFVYNHPERVMGYSGRNLTNEQLDDVFYLRKVPKRNKDSILYFPKDQEYVNRVLDFSNNDGEYDDWKERLKEDFDIKLVEILKRNFIL